VSLYHGLPHEEHQATARDCGVRLVDAVYNSFSVSITSFPELN